MSELEIKNHLITKYIEDGLLDKNLIKIINDDFDPYIYPTEGYIPQCSQCISDFNKLKTLILMEDGIPVEIKHSHSCLWYDYFVKKIKNIYPNSIIVRNKNNLTNKKK